MGRAWKFLCNIFVLIFSITASKNNVTFLYLRLCQQIIIMNCNRESWLTWLIDDVEQGSRCSFVKWYVNWCSLVVSSVASWRSRLVSAARWQSASPVAASDQSAVDVRQEVVERYQLHLYSQPPYRAQGN